MDSIVNVLKEIYSTVKELKQADEDFKENQESFRNLETYYKELEMYLEIKKLAPDLEIELNTFKISAKKVPKSVNEAKENIKKLKEEKKKGHNATQYAALAKEISNRPAWNSKFEKRVAELAKSYETFRIKLLEARKPAERLLRESPTAGQFWLNTGCTDKISGDEFMDKLFAYKEGFDRKANTFLGYDLRLLEKVILSMGSRRDPKEITVDSLINWLHQEGEKEQKYPFGHTLKSALEKQKQTLSVSPLRNSISDIDLSPIFQNSETTTSVAVRDAILGYHLTDFKVQKHFLKYYIESHMMDEEKQVVTQIKVKIWLSKVRKNPEIKHICEIFKVAVMTLFTTERECKKTADNLYKAGKILYNKSIKDPQGKDFDRDVAKGIEMF